MSVSRFKKIQDNIRGDSLDLQITIEVIYLLEIYFLHVLGFYQWNGNITNGNVQSVQPEFRNAFRNICIIFIIEVSMI